MRTILTLIALSLLSSTLALAGQDPVRFFDAHYHFPDDATLEFVGRLQKPGEFFVREGALLLSDYNEDSPEDLFGLQQTLSQSITQDSSGRKLYGLCGVSLRSPIAAEQVKRCLDLPHMVGVKLHLHGSSTRLSNETCEHRHCPPHIVQGYGENLKKWLRSWPLERASFSFISSISPNFCPLLSRAITSTVRAGKKSARRLNFLLA